jgi:hypothetical protein
MSDLLRPATEGTFLAHIHLSTIRSAFDDAGVEAPQEKEEVRRALSFLMTLGKSGLPGTGRVDDPRFLLLALKIFQEAPVQFGKIYQGFWSTYGGIVYELLSEYRQQIYPAAMSMGFEEIFRRSNTPWDIKAQIIDAFSEAANAGWRDKEFWDVTQRFLSACQEGVAKKADAHVAVEALIDFWYMLTLHFGKDSDVRGKMAGAARPLLELIVNAEASPETLADWGYALERLELPVTDPKVRPIPPRDKEIQKAMEEVARRLRKLATECEIPLFRTKIREMESHLMPYLHGFTKEGLRVVPQEGYQECEAIFRFAKGEVKMPVFLADLCARTCRGFRIEVADLKVTGYYDEQLGTNGEFIDGRPVRIVDAYIGADLNTKTITDVELSLRYPAKSSVDGTSTNLVVPAKIVRAWPLGQAPQSGFALLASPDLQPPQDWTRYVKQLNVARL